MQIGMKLKILRPDVSKYTWWTISTVLIRASNAVTSPEALSHLTTICELLKSARKQTVLDQRDPQSIDEGKGKGKGRQSIPLLYSSIHEFHLVARYLQLHLHQVSMFIPSDEELLAEAKQEMLDHFGGPEGEVWCEKSLGAEIWRRETEVEFGSFEGGEWMRAWERLKIAVEGGYVVYFIVRAVL